MFIRSLDEKELENEEFANMTGETAGFSEEYGTAEPGQTVCSGAGTGLLRLRSTSSPDA